MRIDRLGASTRPDAHTCGTAGQQQKLDVAEGVMLSQGHGTDCPSLRRMTTFATLIFATMARSGIGGALRPRRPDGRIPVSHDVKQPLF
jgi:hypothetical protein